MVSTGETLKSGPRGKFFREAPRRPSAQKGSCNFPRKGFSIQGRSRIPRPAGHNYASAGRGQDMASFTRIFRGDHWQGEEDNPPSCCHLPWFKPSLFSLAAQINQTVLGRLDGEPSHPKGFLAPELGSKHITEETVHFSDAGLTETAHKSPHAKICHSKRQFAWTA